jgi:hypothetical protein
MVSHGVWIQKNAALPIAASLLARMEGELTNRKGKHPLVFKSLGQFPNHNYLSFVR